MQEDSDVVKRDNSRVCVWQLLNNSGLYWELFLNTLCAQMVAVMNGRVVPLLAMLVLLGLSVASARELRTKHKILSPHHDSAAPDLESFGWDVEDRFHFVDRNGPVTVQPRGPFGKLAARFLATHVGTDVGVNPRYLLIAYGPPASGKGVVTRTLSTSLGMQGVDTVDTGPDTAIEANEQYRLEIAPCRSFFSTLSVARDHITVTDKIKECSDIYEKYRKQLSGANRQRLQEAITAQNHVIFETTGNNIEYTGTLIDQCKTAGYTIVLFFPIVTYTTVEDRLFSRAKTAGRLPPPDVVRGMYPSIHTNFPVLAANVKVDQVYLYSNEENGDPHLFIRLNAGRPAAACAYHSTLVRFSNDPAMRLSPTIEWLHTLGCFIRVQVSYSGVPYRVIWKAGGGNDMPPTVGQLKTLAYAMIPSAQRPAMSCKLSTTNAWANRITNEDQSLATAGIADGAQLYIVTEENDE